MALSFIKAEPATLPDAHYRTDRRLYWTADDPPRVVEEGDPAARVLWVGVNGLISLADAERYGLLEHNQAVDDGAPTATDTEQDIPTTDEQTDAAAAEGISLGGVLPPDLEAVPLAAAEETPPPDATSAEPAPTTQDQPPAEPMAPSADPAS